MGVLVWDSELYGSLIYNNGFQGPTRGHGHGIYVQNDQGTKLIKDNILFNGFGYGIHAYGEGGRTNGLHIEGNTIVRSGLLANLGTGSDPNILVGGTTNPAERITILDNYGWHSPSAGAINVQMGYGAPYEGDMDFRDNYLVGGGRVLTTRKWQSINLSGNTLIGAANRLVDDTNPGTILYRNWNNNQHYQVTQLQPFNHQGTPYNFSGWRNATGYDSQSTFSASNPTQTQVFVQPNQYEAGRANITVFNHALLNTVNVDVSTILQMGAQYEVRNAQDFFAPPVLTGTYNGGQITLPMNGLTVAQPIGYAGVVVPSGPAFNVFVCWSL